MINAAETQRPITNTHINASETMPPGDDYVEKAGAILSSGESIADSYVVNSLMNQQGKQSYVYLAKKWGKSYVIKVYHPGWRPSMQIQNYLMNVRHPNIARIVECGEHDGNYYEIYDYYAEGTLEDAGALTGTHIQKVIVPSINEGLHELHKNNIVHCDIKPSNLFYCDGESRVVIGDCGISGYANAKGKLVDAIRGTPEYAPRVKSLLWSAAMSSAYDYGSFGLVLCRLVLGKSLFHGMSVEEISRAWENGIELPSQITGRIGTLIKGLINEDEEQRWGYMEVKRWCEGEYLRPVNRSIYARRKKEETIKPLIFGRFGGETVAVATLRQLENAIRGNWTQATKIIRRRELVDFVRQFDETLVDKVRGLSRYHDLDAAVFKLLLYIEDSHGSITYCGKNYESLANFVDCLSGGKDENAIRFVTSGLLVYYLRFCGLDSRQIDKLEQFIKGNGCRDMSVISTLCFALTGQRTIQVFGTTVGSLDDLVHVIHSQKPEKIDALLQDNKLIAWMNRMGYEREMRKMKEMFG